MNKADFFTVSNKPKLVQLDEDRAVYVRKLTQGEVQHLTREYLKNDQKQAEAFSYIVCKCTVDEDGRRVFEDSDQPSMGKVDFPTMKRIAEEIIEYSGMAAAKND